MTDRDLLILYQQNKSPEHFAQLVARNINLVYSVARRHAKDPHLAEDITQEVFLTLAQKAATLKPDIPLAGWLFTTTRLLSLQFLRAASRRSHHETEAAMSHEPPPSLDPTWPLIAQDIDQAIADLPPTDRDALLLRFFTGQSHPEIAATLAISEEAAKKRVQRALDSLQKLLTSRGIATTSALALAAALSTHAVQAAPPALASSVTSAVTTKTALTLTTKGALMATAKLKTTLIAAAALLTLTATVGIYSFTSLLHHSPSKTLTEDPLPAPAQSDPVPSPAEIQAIKPEVYLAAYTLPPGQGIASFPAIDPAVRAAFYQNKDARQYQSNEKTPDAMAVQWKSDQCSVWDTNYGASLPLKALLSHLIDIYPMEIKSPLPLPKIQGDIVFKTDAPESQYVAGLQSLLSQAYEQPVTCSIRTEPTDVVVFSGTYKFTPPDPSHLRTKNTIDFYLNDLDVKESTGKGGGNARVLAGTIGDYIHQPVIIDCPNFPPRLEYQINRKLTRPILLPEDIDLFLQHLSEQTGLTVTHETRALRCLIIQP